MFKVSFHPSCVVGNTWTGTQAVHSCCTCSWCLYLFSSDSLAATDILISSFHKNLWDWSGVSFMRAARGSSSRSIGRSVRRFLCPRNRECCVENHYKLERFYLPACTLKPKPESPSQYNCKWRAHCTRNWYPVCGANSCPHWGHIPE